jgi:hypothetical protein
MSDALLAALRPVVAHLTTFLSDKPELKRDLAAAARAVADWIEASKADPSSLPVPAEPPMTPAPVAAATVEPARRESVLDELILPVPVVPKSFVPAASFTTPPPGDHGREFIPLPLTTVAARCRVKAAASKLIAKRVAGTAAADLHAEEMALRKQAEQIPDCGLWMFDPDGSPRSKAVWDDLAGGFLVAAAAADLLRAWTATGADLTCGQEVLTLAAEAQSMLLYAVADVGWVSRDHEQVQMFVHIRELGKHHQIYVPRFLRREDPADPAKWPDLAERLKAMGGRFGGAIAAPGQPAPPADPAKVRAKTLSNLKFKLRKLAEEPDGSTDEWPRVAELLDQAVAAGVPPTSLDLRELLLPVYDRLPPDLPTTAAAERVFRAIEQYRDTQLAVTEPPPLEEPPSPQVAQVADWLRGKELVLIGGHRRPHHVAALKRVFGLADVRWLSFPEHTSITAFEADIARPEVAVVILAIRWANHDYADVNKYCQKYGKPFIRLRAGYNPNQIAHHVTEQAGDRLAAVASDGFSAGL